MAEGMSGLKAPDIRAADQFDRPTERGRHARDVARERLVIAMQLTQASSSGREIPFLSVVHRRSTPHRSAGCPFMGSGRMLTQITAVAADAVKQAPVPQTDTTKRREKSQAEFAKAMDEAMRAETSQQRDYDVRQRQDLDASRPDPSDVA
jgi:hypothetical protein